METGWGAGTDSPLMDRTTRQAVQDRDLINGSETDAVSRLRLELLSEKQYADLVAKSHVAVYEHKGRFWRNSNQFGSLLLVPVHWMAELTPKEATFPRRSTLGIKARVTDSTQNNAFLNLFMIDDPRSYCFDTITPNARNKIRKACREGVQIDLATPKLLEEHGYEVMRDSLTKSGYRRPPEKQDYLRSLRDGVFLGGHRLVLAGTVTGNGRQQSLGAIATGMVIDGTAYGDDLYVAPWARSSYVGPLIVYTFIQACQRTPGVERIVLGRATRDQRLDGFKASMSIPRRDVPAMVAFRKPVRPAIPVLLAATPKLRKRLYGR